MPADWYCRIQEKIHGPLTGPQLQRLAESGKLRPTDVVKKTEYGKWIPASAVKGLKFGAALQLDSEMATKKTLPKKIKKCAVCQAVLKAGQSQCANCVQDLSTGKQRLYPFAKKNVYVWAAVGATFACVFMIIASTVMYFAFFRESPRTTVVTQKKSPTEVVQKRNDDEVKRLADAKQKAKDEEAKRLADAAQKAKNDEVKRLADAAQKAKDDEAKRLADAAQKAKDDEAKRLADATPKVLDGEAIVKGLIAQLRNDDGPTRLKAIKSLGDKGQSAKAALPVLLEMVKDNDGKNSKFQSDLFRSIEQIGIDQSYVPVLIAELRKNVPHPFVTATLLGIAGEPAIAPLLSLLDDPTFIIRNNALGGLMRNRSLNASMVPRLVKCLDDSEEIVRSQAAGTLGALGVEAKDAVPALIVALGKKNISAAGALGLIGPEAKAGIPALRSALKDKTTSRTSHVVNQSDVGNVLIRQDHLAEIAAAALGRMGPDAGAAVPDLLKATTDSRPAVRQQAVFALGKIRSVAAVPALMMILEKKPVDNDELDKAAARALADIGQPAVPALLRAGSSKIHSARLGAAIALAQMRPMPAQAIPAVRPFLKDADIVARTRAVVVLGRMGKDGEDAVPDLVVMIMQPEQPDTIKKKIAEALAVMGEKVGPAMLKCSKDDSASTRRWAAFILGTTSSPPPETVSTLAALLDKDGVAFVRVAAAKALADFGPEAKLALPVIRRRAETDPDPEVRTAAGLAIKKLME